MGTSISACQIFVHKEMTTDERWVTIALLLQVQDHSILSGTLIHD